jgi:hypothetical protein
MLHPRILAVLAPAFLVPFALPSSAAADGAGGPAWAAFVGLVAGANDVVETLVTHETVGTRSADVTYKISFRKPTDARCEIVAGPGKGGVSVWRGGDKVTAQSGDSYIPISVIMDRTDPLVTDVIGTPCGAAALPIMAQTWPVGGTLLESAGTAFDGVDTDLVTFTPHGPAPVTKEELYLSKTTHLPVVTKGYRGDQLVETTLYKGIVINGGVSGGAFSL